jgi:hypothetical protein
MRKKMQTEAEAFSQAIDARMTGSQKPDPTNVPVEELELAGEMIELARGAVPGAGFATELERRLLREADRRKRAPRPVTVRRWIYAGAGVVAVASVALLAVMLLGGRAPVPDSEIAGGVSSPTMPMQTTEPATPSTPQEPPLLPSLAELTGRGVGGQGGPTPEGLTLVLETSLPGGPQALMVYSLGEAEVLTAEAARNIGAQFDLGGSVYMPLWMADAQAVADLGHNTYFVVDGAQQLMLEGSESWEYMNREGSLYVQGHFREPAALPGEGEAEAIATGFLEDLGLWMPSSNVRLSGNVVRFYAVFGDGYELSEPYAWVELGDGGKVESVRYRLFPELALGEYPLYTAEDAFAMLNSSNHGDETWFSGVGNLRAWGEFSGMNPHYWARSYADGEQANLFGTPLVLLPTTTGQEPYVQLHGIELQGMQADLADFVIGMGGPVHVWGTVEQASGYAILHVTGWEAGQVVNVSGWIRTSGGAARLEGNDGQVYILPDLPADLPEGSEVFVEGGVVGGMLDWNLIQAMPDPGQPGGQPGGATGVGHIQEVALVYFAPPVGYAPPEARPRVDYRAILPVWRFRGQDDSGAAFEIYVQAVDSSGVYSDE